MSKEKRKESSKILSLLRNDRFVMILSLILAVIFWAGVCVSFSPQTISVIKDVPIVIDMENSVPDSCGLQIFGDDNFTVDITVSGSRYVIGENLLSAKDFKVIAVTSNVNSPGLHPLQVKVSKVNEDANFTIDNISESSISVYFDALAKSEIPVTVKLNKQDFVKTGYITDENFILDDEKVTVSGAATEIAQLDSVIADVQIADDELSTTTTYSAPLTAYNKAGTPLKYVQINGQDNAEISVNVPVYRMGSHGLDVKFTNTPPMYSKNADSYLECSFSPSSLNIAVLQNGTAADKINIGEIDFSQVKAGENKFKFNLVDVKNIKADSTKVKTVDVSLDMEKIATKKVDLTMDNLSVLNVPDENNIKFYNSSVNVTLYGKKSELEKLDSASLTASIDLEENTVTENNGRYEGPIRIKNADSCWIYGKYELSYTLTK
ncbi:MAG: CdaR family protein [Clostridia bacterium]|nr:CdaR family protein [Clostridia bacterium]